MADVMHKRMFYMFFYTVMDKKQSMTKIKIYKFRNYQIPINGHGCRLHYFLKLISTFILIVGRVMLFSITNVVSQLS